MLKLYSVFHLNLNYSSISISERKKVITACYWPLLNIAQELEVPLGIEVSGYSLEEIAALDAMWLAKLRELTAKGQCVVAGSGYTQLIGPLVPALVNRYNLAFGNRTYLTLLGAQPELYYVNEQAYSASLVEQVREAGYKALVMEWNNPRRFHPEWDSEWQYHPQQALGMHGTTIPLIWNNSVSFQRLQGFAHGELNRFEYLSYIQSHLSPADRVFSWYGSDAEVFDYRPGRFAHEKHQSPLGEWGRIRDLLTTLKSTQGIAFISLRTVLADKGCSAAHSLQLESSEDPIPVKKQEKYNISRWGLAGRSNVTINTRCYRVFEGLRGLQTDGELPEAQGPHADLWKRLCFLWSSDFRTHVSAERFARFNRDLSVLEKDVKRLTQTRRVASASACGEPMQSCGVRFDSEQGRIRLEHPAMRLSLKPAKGLCIEELTFPPVDARPLLGTLAQGYYESLPLAADFFSGHSVMEIPAQPKVTDLVSIPNPEALQATTAGRPLKFSVPFGNGRIEKEIWFDSSLSELCLRYHFAVNKVPPASLRTCIITVNPAVFDKESLYYACHLGGEHKEVFKLAGVQQISPGPVSLNVSARTALGATDGVLELGDAKRKIILRTNPAECAALPLLHYASLPNTFFLRVLYSLREFDDTTFLTQRRPRGIRATLTLRIAAIKT
jgi:hypothetical protein